MIQSRSFPTKPAVPADGWHKFELWFVGLIICKNLGEVNDPMGIYQNISDPLDKFIFMYVKELNYPQEAVAEYLGISQAAVNHRLQKTIEHLRRVFAK